MIQCTLADSMNCSLETPNFCDAICQECCKDNIFKSNYLCDNTKSTWRFLIDSYAKATSTSAASSIDDNRLLIILSYTAIPSLLHKSFRDILKQFFIKKEISSTSLKKGKWLHQSMNINRVLLEDIIESQKISFKEKTIHNNAIDFFIQDSDTSLSRNKAAHNFVDSFKHSQRADVRDCMTRLHAVIHFIICLDDYVWKYGKEDEKNKFEEKINKKTEVVYPYLDLPQNIIYQIILGSLTCKQTRLFDALYRAGYCDEKGVLTAEGQSYFMIYLE